MRVPGSSLRSAWGRARRVAAGLLAAFACGGAGDDDYPSRMAAQHADDRPVASQAARAEPAGAVEAREVVYGEHDGHELRGFLARPAGEGSAPPGVLVIHEWWGLNDNIRAMARQLAGEGYLALAVDLYEGRVTEDPGQARELFQEAMANASRTEANLRQAHAFLRNVQRTPRVGVIGWCFGGTWSLRTALLLPDRIDATVIYYGSPVLEAERLRALQSPILGLFGEADRGIPVERVRSFEQTLGDLGKQAKIHVFPGADHAFANPSGTRYQAEAAQQAWAETRAFLRAHLRP